MKNQYKDMSKFFDLPRKEKRPSSPFKKTVLKIIILFLLSCGIAAILKVLSWGGDIRAMSTTFDLWPTIAIFSVISLFYYLDK